MILPNDNTATSNDTRNLVANTIDLMKAELALRGMRNTSNRGVVIFADSAADLERLVAEVDQSDLVKNHSASKPVRGHPQIVDFGVGTDSTGDKIIQVLEYQNATLENDITFKKFFEGKKGRNGYNLCGSGVVSLT